MFRNNRSCKWNLNYVVYISRAVYSSPSAMMHGNNGLNTILFYLTSFHCFQIRAISSPSTDTAHGKPIIPKANCSLTTRIEFIEAITGRKFDFLLDSSNSHIQFHQFANIILKTLKSNLKNFPHLDIVSGSLVLVLG